VRQNDTRVTAARMAVLNEIQHGKEIEDRFGATYSALSDVEERLQIAEETAGQIADIRAAIHRLTQLVLGDDSLRVKGVVSLHDQFETIQNTLRMQSAAMVVMVVGMLILLAVFVMG